MTLPAALALVRFLHLAALMSFAGCAALRVMVAPPVLAPLDLAFRERVERRQALLAWISLGGAVTAGLVFAALQAAVLADAASASAAMAALGIMLADTVFGHAMLWRAGLLALAVVTWRRPALCAALALAAVAMQAGMGHTVAAGGFLLTSGALHAAAAAAWLGGLLPLLLLVHDVPGPGARRAAQRFSPLGMTAVATLSVTAAVQGWLLIGGVPALLGTPYGWVALGKLALFGLLLALAALNRQRLVKRADVAPAPLLVSIAAEAVLGVLVVAAAAALSQLEPGVHRQPVWPFSWQPSLALLGDPDLGPQAQFGLMGLVSAMLFGGMAVVSRRRRVAALILTAAGLIAAWPRLDLLMVPATPTSFYVSPTGFSAASIARGGALYATHCAACHGATGRGDGPAGRGLRIPPMDLTQAHVLEHPDGEMFWWLTHGIDDPRGGLAMPGFAGLPEDDRWNLIDFTRARAAGAGMALEGMWPAPVQAPALSAACGDGRTLTNTDLRGRVWLVLVGAAADPGGLPAIRIAPDGPPGACLDRSDAAQEAFALLTGAPPVLLQGGRFLVDAGGWLRAYAGPDEPLDPALAGVPLPPPEAAHHH